jgi:hypothetical protein
MIFLGFSMPDTHEMGTGLQDKKPRPAFTAGLSFCVDRNWFSHNHFCAQANFISLFMTDCYDECLAKGNGFNGFLTCLDQKPLVGSSRNTHLLTSQVVSVTNEHCLYSIRVLGNRVNSLKRESAFGSGLSTTGQNGLIQPRNQANPYSF